MDVIQSFRRDFLSLRPTDPSLRALNWFILECITSDTISDIIFSSSSESNWQNFFQLLLFRMDIDA